MRRQPNVFPRVKSRQVRHPALEAEEAARTYAQVAERASAVLVMVRLTCWPPVFVHTDRPARRNLAVVSTGHCLLSSFPTDLDQLADLTLNPSLDALPVPENWTMDVEGPL